MRITILILSNKSGKNENKCAANRASCCFSSIILIFQIQKHSMNVIFYLAYDIQYHISSENVKLKPVCMKLYYGRLY